MMDWGDCFFDIHSSLGYDTEVSAFNNLIEPMEIYLQYEHIDGVR